MGVMIWENVRFRGGFLQQLDVPGQRDDQHLTFQLSVALKLIRMQLFPPPVNFPGLILLTHTHTHTHSD